jgi:hypothetical protein
MMDLLAWKMIPAFPPRTGRTTVKHQLRHRTDAPVRVVQCGNQILIGFKISPLVPLHMANEQIQGVVVSSDGGAFRPRARQTNSDGAQSPILSIYVLFSLASHALRALALPRCIGKI